MTRRLFLVYANLILICRFITSRRNIIKKYIILFTKNAKFKPFNPAMSLTGMIIIYCFYHYLNVRAIKKDEPGGERVSEERRRIAKLYIMISASLDRFRNFWGDYPVVSNACVIFDRKFIEIFQKFIICWKKI